MDSSVNRNALDNLISGIEEKVRGVGSEWSFFFIMMDGTIHHRGDEITEEELHQREERYRERNGPLPKPAGIDFRPPDTNE